MASNETKDRSFRVIPLAQKVIELLEEEEDFEVRRAAIKCVLLHRDLRNITSKASK
jgi:hypothetical protein